MYCTGSLRNMASIHLIYFERLSGVYHITRYTEGISKVKIEYRGYYEEKIKTYKIERGIIRNIMFLTIKLENMFFLNKIAKIFCLIAILSSLSKQRQKH